MQSIQHNSEDALSHNKHEELTQKIDSDMKAKQLRRLQDFENFQQDDSRRRRPKFSYSNMKRSPMKKNPLKFAPFLASTLEVTGNAGFFYGAIFYNEKHNMIVACPKNNTVQFYNATTLLPIEERKTLQLESSVLQIAYCAETDVCLFACMHGKIYAYDLSNHVFIINVLKTGESNIPAITFISPTLYITSLFQLKKISVGNLKDGGFLFFKSPGSEASSFCNSEKRVLLISGLADGSLRVYRTDRLPQLPACGKSSKGGGMILKVEIVRISGKEYILTGEIRGIMKLWCFIKGKIRLLRVINTEDKIYGFVFLENYKMGVVSCKKDYVKFFSLPSGKFVCRYHFSQFRPMSVFLMKDKNSLGFGDSQKGVVKIVKLDPELRVIEID